MWAAGGKETVGILDCNVTDIGCIVVDWIRLALDRDIYLAVVMRVKNPAVP